MSRRSAPRPKHSTAARTSTGSSFALHADAAPAQDARLWLRLAWIVLGVFAVVLLAIALGPHTVGDNFAETDFYGGYAEGARALQKGRVDPSRYGVVGPGYEAALALLGFVIPDLLLAAELLSIAAILTGAAFWLRLLAARGGGPLAFVASLFLVTNPALLQYGYSATNDSLAFALQGASLYFLLARTGPRDAIVAGVLGGLAFLTRYNSAALLPAGVIAVLLGGTAHERRGAAALGFAGAFIAPVLPWVAFSLARGQSFSFQFHHNIAYDVFARAQGIPWDDYQKILQPQFHSLADVIARDPAAVMRRLLFNVWDHLRRDARDLMGLPVAICALAGVVIAAWDRSIRRLWPILVFAVLLFLSLVPNFYSERYGIPLVPVWAGLAAAAFASPRLALAVGRGRRVWLKPALALVPLGLSVQDQIRTTARHLDQIPYEVLDGADALRRLRRPGDAVISRKPHIAFHGGVTAVPFPFTRSLPDLASYARARGARWLYFSWPEAEMRPAYWYLLDTTSAVPGLIVRSVGRRPAVLYEIGPEFGRLPSWAGNDTLNTWHTMRAKLMVHPGNVEALLSLANIEHQRGAFSSAKTHLERAVRLQPRLVPGWLLLGEIALSESDGARARQCYERVLATNPDLVAARVGLGWAALVSRDAIGAARIWRPLIGSTHDPATLDRMADLFGAIGDRAAEADARAALARAMGAR